MQAIPLALRDGVFTAVEADAHGVGRRMLQGRRFVRVFPRVYRIHDHAMTPADWRRAAALTLPEDAALTGVSRLQAGGLRDGPTLPLHFVLTRDLHHEITGIFLHRTVQMPPLDDVGVTPAAAFLSLCRFGTVLRVVRIGCWLLHHGHATRDEIAALALAQPWRDGAREALWVLEHLDQRPRSLAEAELMTVLAFAGIPRGEPNVAVTLVDGRVIVVDLLLEGGLVLEYEGTHHQADRVQYVADIDRYAVLRDLGRPYLQVTKERLAQRRVLVGEVYRAMLRCGYRGPPPDLTGRFTLLDRPLHDVVPRRRRDPLRYLGT